ncbi:hypothetical protein Nepgr_002941 [Nepenthes gracilis]|uniref:Uncharacterized protein n=1 Tax=Nepenthes gracilis TaxID=150966 RepID=A0AAD3PAF7_NEPGR|nr:hypothetical protein Nepgr_002941 [Nepenthes gracilis]
MSPYRSSAAGYPPEKALQEGDESCLTDGLVDVNADMVSSISVMEKVPPIANHAALGGAGAQHPTDAPTLPAGYEACFLIGPSADASDMLAFVQVRWRNLLTGGTLVPDYSVIAAAIGWQRDAFPVNAFPNHEIVLFDGEKMLNADTGQ